MSILNHPRKRRRLTRALAWLGLIVISSGIALWSSLQSEFYWSWVGVLVAGLIGDRWMRDEGGVAVLGYHSVSNEPAWLPWAEGITVSTETFRHHLQELGRMACNVISTRQLVEARQTGSDLPPRPVVIHFDDGYLDNWVAAAPLLRAFQMPATIFVSLDFIDPGLGLRPTLTDIDAGRCERSALDWTGYMNREELRSLDKEGLVDIQTHGTDHGRVETGPCQVDELRPDNWRRLAWVQWRGMPGNKSRWFRGDIPPAVPLGTPVLENDGALVARSWSAAEGLEKEQTYEARVKKVFFDVKQGFLELLEKDVGVFCWPENLYNAHVHRLALDTGYRVTTGGKGENRAGEDPTVISRVHVTDRALGFRWIRAERLALRATVRLSQGNYYWFFVLIPMYAVRRHVLRLGRSSRVRR